MKDILTEDEAKQRCCPYMFEHLHALGEDDPPTNCIASDCMAWRLSHKEGPSGEETGYCGAFGIPRFT